MIKDIIAISSLQDYAIAGLMIFILVFVMIVFKVMRASDEEIAAAANLPLEVDK